MSLEKILIIAIIFVFMLGLNALLIFTSNKEVKKQLFDKDSKNRTNEKEFNSILKQCVKDKNKNHILYCISIADVKSFEQQFGAIQFAAIIKEILNRCEQVISKPIAICKTSNYGIALIAKQNISEMQIKELCEFLILEVTRPITLADAFKIKLKVNVVAVDLSIVSDITRLREKIELNISKQKSIRYNTYDLINDEIQTEDSQQVKFYDELVRAIEYREFEINYSPIINKDTLQIIGFECFPKWKRNGELVSTEKFIEILDQSNELSMKVMLWTYEQILKQRKKWEIDFNSKDFQLFFEIYPSQIIQSTLIDDLRQITRQFTFNNRNLVFQVSNWNQIIQLEKMRNNLKFLQKMGYEVLSNNFELVDTDFAKLKKNNLSAIKIDINHLYNSSSKPISEQVLNILIQYCKNQNIDIIIKNVSKKEDLDLINKYNLKIIEGDLVSQALEASSFKQLKISKLNIVEEIENIENEQKANIEEIDNQIDNETKKEEENIIEETKRKKEAKKSKK